MKVNNLVIILKEKIDIKYLKNRDPILYRINKYKIPI